jgi:hypothetical protein
MSADARQRTISTVLVAIAATLVVAALIAGSPVIHGLVSRLPAVPSDAMAVAVAVAVALGATPS